MHSGSDAFKMCLLSLSVWRTFRSIIISIINELDVCKNPLNYGNYGTHFVYTVIRSLSVRRKFNFGGNVYASFYLHALHHIAVAMTIFDFELKHIFVPYSIIFTVSHRYRAVPFDLTLINLFFFEYIFGKKTVTKKKRESVIRYNPIKIFESSPRRICLRKSSFYIQCFFPACKYRAEQNWVNGENSV